jgi:hypothetical protein
VERAFVPVMTVTATLAKSVDRAALLDELAEFAAYDAQFDFVLNDHASEVIASCCRRTIRAPGRPWPCAPSSAR